jgi:hypothetical protein
MNWSLKRCKCGEPPVASLALVWDDDIERARTDPYCRVHLQESLGRWDRIRAAFPEAVDGLRVLVVA